MPSEHGARSRSSPPTRHRCLTSVTSEELASSLLLKIDVDGYEAAAVHGLLPALPKLRDDVEIMIEVTPRLLTKQGRTIRRPYAGPDPRCAGPGRSPR